MIQPARRPVTASSPGKCPLATTAHVPHGLSAIPPRPDPAIVLPALELGALRSDAALMHVPVPWDSLLLCLRADSLVMRNLVGLRDYYRAKGFELVAAARLGPAAVRLGRTGGRRPRPQAGAGAVGQRVRATVAVAGPAIVNGRGSNLLQHVPV
jgi:hypothetical protein